ncbi:hypothetical protein CHRYSEOSP005_18940 [Chryseobacterium sp. Alg-005]|uniref:hypothetical protein n=1 Tax=Chryseobacterium sp. Alg-005 TaxID=3159516 RepID=UPI003555B30F
MIKNIIVFCLISLSFCNAQVLDEYPKKQDFYEGGLTNFYKEAHDYLLNNNFKECDAREIYQPRILVTKDAVVKVVKDNDTAYIAKNKCAYDLSIEIIKNLKHWKSAEVKGGKIGAITEFIFYPKDIMSNYKDKYNANNFVISAQYPKGDKAFHRDFHDEFMALFADYHINGTINLEFYIDKEGHITNSRIYPQISDKKFNIDFLRTLSRLKETWKPALYLNIPIKERFVYPMNFSTNFRER